MKKAIIRICLVVMLMGLFSTGVFAEGEFELTESYPKDGQKNTSVENVGVKLTFNTDVNSEANKIANDKCFSITDEEGNKIPVKVYYNPKETKQILVLYDSNAENAPAIKGNTEYTLTVSGDLVDNQGNALGAEEVITFKTLNQQLSNRIYLILMVVMMAGMVFMGTRQAGKKTDKQEAQELAAAKAENFNPYKEAKRTGKSVEEVMAQHEKEVAKREARAAKLAAKLGEDEEEEEEIPEDNGNYKVGRPRTVASGGSSYITGRKAAAEARQAEEERLARRRAAAKKKKK